MESSRFSRREVLRAGTVLGAAAGLSGCERLASWADRTFGEGSVPESIAVATGDAIDPAFHLLSRAAFGPRPGDLERVRELGAEAWIDEQLQPGSIDDGWCDLRARRFETIHLEPGDCFEFKKKVLREEIARHTLLRAIYSKRQLLEVLVEFWSDHFNIDLAKGDCIYLKAADDREVIRSHALGKFRDLVLASARSPAMLVYLDGTKNRRRRPEEMPNENYARELLELHTLGVGGGYTQEDVAEAARALTGWRVKDGWGRGRVEFESKWHDDAAKRILGVEIQAGGGEEDIERVVEIACRHPSTARHIAWKLARRFVAEEPPESLVERAARVFSDSDGDIRSALREILLSDEFSRSAAAKVKRPFRFVAGALRAVQADTHAHGPLLLHLGRMGQEPFSYPTPDGYPEEGAHWLGTLLARWNFAFALARDKIKSVDAPVDAILEATGGDEAPEALFGHFVGRAPTRDEERALASVPSSIERVGLVLASPAHQRF